MLSQESIKRLITCVLLTLCWMIVLAHASSQHCDINACPGVQKLYTELGCSPSFKSGDCCPTKYECPDFSARRKDKCYVNGQEFGVDESIPKEHIKQNCIPMCRCSQYNPDEAAKLVCATMDCGEFFAARDPTCILTYSEDSCCSTGRVCGEEKAKATQCYFEGESYIEGQRMYPAKQSCYTCLCTAGFDNSTIDGNPNCKQVNCGFDMHHSEKLKSGCVPIYLGDNKCCPIDWRCPKASTDEVVKTGRSDSGSKESCVFGDLRVSVGDELNAESKEVTCNCVTPPYVQCIREKRSD